MESETQPKQANSNQNSSPSFVKLAMKNMVRKGNQSLFHFFLTAMGLGLFLLILASIGRPNIPH